MRKTLIVLGCMSLGLAHAQQNGRDHTQHQAPDARVGINTENPVATLELKKVEGLPATQVQGFLLPHLTQEERNSFTKEALVNGVMIFNTTKNCIDWWDGTNWQCQNGTQKDEHGDEYGKYRATFTYTATADFTKNDCPADKRGSKVSYSNTIIGKAISNTSQEEADRLAEENAKAEFNRLGQIEANTRGNCYDTIGRCQPLIDKYPNGNWALLNGYTSVLAIGSGPFDYGIQYDKVREGIELTYIKSVEPRRISAYFGTVAHKCSDGRDYSAGLYGNPCGLLGLTKIGEAEIDNSDYMYKNTNYIDVEYCPISDWPFGGQQGNLPSDSYFVHYIT